MRRTKMAVLGMMMVLSMTACAGKAETKSIGAEITVQETTAEEMTTETVKADRGESEESMIGMPNLELDAEEDGFDDPWGQESGENKISGKICPLSGKR